MLTRAASVDTVMLEDECRRRNVWWRGEIHIYQDETRLRGSHTGSTLSLWNESVGIEQD